MLLPRKMNTLPKADCYICLKVYHIFDICSTHFRQRFPLLAYGTLYHFLTFHKLSVNVIIHLEVKLNCSQILKNTCLPNVSVHILAVLCYKDEQLDILLIPPQYEEI